MATSLEKRLSYAAQYALYAPEQALEPAVPIDYRLAPDNEPLVLRDNSCESPYSVTTNSPTEFREMLVALFSLANRTRTPNPKAQRYINRTARHEASHLEALLASEAAPEDLEQGLLFCRKTVKPPTTLQPDAGDLLTVTPFSTARKLTTTKLGYAAILARPIDPSDGDMHDLRQKLGYTDVYDVAQRIRTNNRNNRDQLLSPGLVSGPWFRTDEAGKLSSLAPIRQQLVLRVEQMAQIG